MQGQGHRRDNSEIFCLRSWQQLTHCTTKANTHLQTVTYVVVQHYQPEPHNALDSR